ncbi:hypothetical protein Cob_v011103 [Colletotrichum orbiculare MAFF 240422]|uniref:Uncharacterized protein n=1 Tax=Colletotrichum orbiculare (strain 104-T / ATCC 96160 / CBS 514.97 / LARS 414 / MAFF 240422) TaxID=1213857 RepID=A0A484FCG6_COLOR|nr:hypothetical protein Cob_v011103 [Colletotrichum orbiculare MAFF 240422]
MDGREGTIHGLKICRGSCLHYRDSFDVVEDIIEPDVRHENQRVTVEGWARGKRQKAEGKDRFQTIPS